MDVMEELGALALGSRLKRLSDALMQDGARIYQAAGMGFEPRWFPVIVYLYRRGPTAITELARGLGVSHPGINKIANEMIEARIVAPYRDRKDKRKRVLALTRTGREKYQAMQPVWRDIRQALQSLVDDAGGGFLSELARLERVTEQRGFHDRYADLADRPATSVRISRFDERHASAFRALNLAWIEQHFQVEEADLKVLDNPGELIASGGDILFAIESGSDEPVGTCALIKQSDQVAELAKMAVAEAAKGRQIGAQLGEAAVARAKAMGFQQLVLESNRQLMPALNLYRRLGFIEAPFPVPSDYRRANIYMTLDLGTGD